MALTDAGKDLLLNGLAASVTFVSLHTDEPDNTGSDEVSASPYQRRAIAWDAAASASMISASTIVFDVAAATTIEYLGYWSASSAGTFYGARELDSPQTFNTPGTYTIAAGNVLETITDPTP